MPIRTVDGPLRSARFDGADAAEVALADGSNFLVVRRIDPPVTVYLFYPADILSEQKRAAAWPLVVLSIVGLVGVLVMGFFIARSIAQPIEQISAQAARIQDRPAPIDLVSGSREIRQLVRGLNDMFAALRASQALALEAEKGRLIKELAVGVAHEIKNPLQAIKLLIQMQPGLSAEDRRLLLNEITRIELASLELLSVESPARLKLEPLSLGKVVDETLDLLQQQLAHLKIGVSRELGAVPEVEGDPDRLKRVVMNLILNGAQAMPGGGELSVRLERRDGVVRFSVTDRGAGVPEDVRPRLFEPFVTTKGDGVGLGLFVTKRIVEGHRGRIGFDSAPGLTTFFFELPCPRS
jgi:signal transduction histidine kinase